MERLRMESLAEREKVRLKILQEHFPTASPAVMTAYAIGIRVGMNEMYFLNEVKTMKNLMCLIKETSFHKGKKKVKKK